MKTTARLVSREDLVYTLLNDATEMMTTFNVIATSDYDKVIRLLKAAELICQTFPDEIDPFYLEAIASRIRDCEIRNS